MMHSQENILLFPFASFILKASAYKDVNICKASSIP